MPKITDMQIQKKNKTRANVYLDGEYAFALEMLTVMKLGLKIGQDVSQKKIEEASFDTECMVAFDKAINYLSRNYKTSKQMKDYLTGKGFSEQVVEIVLQKLHNYKYVNDEQYAKMYVEQQSKTKGKIRLKQELLQKGIAVDVVDQHVQVDDESMQENAQKLAEKYMKNKTGDTKNIVRLQRYLLSRGYDYGTVNSIIRQFKDDTCTLE